MGSLKNPSIDMEKSMQDIGVEYITPASSEFENVREVYVKTTARPLGVARPATAEQVASVVQLCLAHDLPFAVRVGGHDCQSRTIVDGALSLDLRRLDHIAVSEDRQTARIGGGVLIGALLDNLWKQELTLPTGTVGWVGYVGWATLGGYGPSAAARGLGVDQIVGARIVNAKGELVTASARELKGIRGAGGNFGVIVEVTSKVYPAEEIHAGTIIYESSDIKKTVTTYLNNYNKLVQSEQLPANLNAGVLVFNIPGAGTHLSCDFSWRGARDSEFDKWTANMTSLAPLLGGQFNIAPSDPVQMAKAIEAMCPPFMRGTPQTVSLTRFSDKAIETVAHFAETIPHLPNCMISVHFLRAVSPSADPGKEAESVFPGREPHIVVEMLGTHGEEEDTHGATKWSRDFRNAMAATDAAQSWSWVPLTAKEYAGIDQMYGKMANELNALKKELDPDNVFRYAVPRM